VDPTRALAATEEAISATAGEIGEAVRAFGGGFDEAEAVVAEEDDPPLAVERVEAGKGWGSQREVAVAAVAVGERREEIFGVLALSRVWGGGSASGRGRRRGALAAALGFSFLHCLGFGHWGEKEEEGDDPFGV